MKKMPYPIFHFCENTELRQHPFAKVVILKVFFVLNTAVSITKKRKSHLEKDRLSKAESGSIQ
jgi:hypothetical protein